MKRIALIHTVKSVLDSFEGQLRAALGDQFGELKIHNLYDDFLATDPADTGVFSTVNKARLYNDMQAAALTGADLIVVSCSTLTPTVMQIRPFIQTPVVPIDDAMTQKAVSLSSRIGLLATANSTVKPTQQKLMADAQAAGKQITLETLVNEEAIRALKAGDQATHDRLVTEMARSLRHSEIIVLAQASMAHMEEPLAAELGCTVLSSPKLCFQQVKTILESLDQNH